MKALTDILASCPFDVFELVLNAIRNICKNSSIIVRDQFIDEGIISKITDILDKNNLNNDLIIKIALTLSRLLREYPMPPLYII